MKKISIRYIIIFIFLIINCSVLIYAFVKLNNINKVEQIPEFDDISTYNYNEYLNKSKKEIIVECKDLYEYNEFQGYIYAVENNDLYCDYIVDTLESNLYVSMNVNEQDLIGSFGDERIYTSHKGKIVNIINESNKYIVTIFKNTKYYIDILVHQDLYYGYDFISCEDRIFLELNDNCTLDVVYGGIDYEYGVVNGFIKIKYYINNNENVIVPETIGKLKVLKKLHKNMKVISADFNDNVPLKNQSVILLKRKENDENNFEMIEKFVSSTINDYYVIIDDKINVGDIFYDIE